MAFTYKFFLCKSFLLITSNEQIRAENLLPELPSKQCTYALYTRVQLQNGSASCRYVPRHRIQMSLHTAQVVRCWEYLEHGTSRFRDFSDLICL